MAEAVGGLAWVAVILIGVVLVTQLSERGRGVAGAAGSSAVAAAPNGAAASAMETPASAPATDIPTASPEAIASPSIEPGATPTPRPSRTPKPVVDPRPEGTPHYHLASGQLGQTIPNDEISVRVDRAAIPATFDLGLCTRTDPGAEALAFAITETWTRWTRVEWVFEMGGQPMVHWIEDAPGYRNGETIVLVACHWPGDSTRIVIYSGPYDHTDVPEDYRWTIR